MTIQQINIGTSPNDNTGDDPRTAAQKLNSNFSTPAHAASREVGTLAGNIPDADDLDMVGADKNYTSNNLNPNMFGGAGFVAAGWAHTSTEARIKLRTLSNSDALTRTLGGGEFDVLQGSALVTGGDNTTSLVLGSTSLNTGGCTIIQVTGLSGMTPNDSVQLFGNSASSTITVNFE